MKYKSLICAIAMSMGMLTVPLAQADLNDGLVAHYPFDGNAQDTSGNGYHGTVSGASLVGGNGYEFNGKDNIITVSSDSLKQEFPANGSITLSAWINFKGYTKWEGARPYDPRGHMIIVAMDVGRAIQTRASLRIDHDGYPYYYSRDHEIGGEDPASYLVSDTPVPMNEWHHVAVAHQGTEAILYLDGKPVAQDSSFTALMAPWGSSTSASIGAWTDWWGVEESTFNGTIDDVFFYNRALSDSEIKALYEYVPHKDACQLYAVHDEGLNNSQLFTVNPDTLKVNALGKLHKKHDLEALDIHPQTGELFAASGDDTPKKGYLYHVNKTTGEVTAIGATGCREVDALSFHPNGTLWGWAQDCGLITINTDTGKANVEIPASQVEVEDITWNTAGTILYGVENLHGDHKPDSHGAEEDNYYKDLDFDQGVKLWTYNYSTGAINTICDDLTQSQIEIEALETLPDNNVLFGFHGKDGILNVGAVNVQNCQLIAQEELPTVPYNDVEGIAWPTTDCETQCPIEEAELVAKFEWTESGYVFEKPEGNEGLITITGNAESGTWRSEIPMSHIILKGGTNTGTIGVSDQQSGEFSNTVIPDNNGGNTPDISNIQFFGCPNEDEVLENNPNAGEALIPGRPGGFAVGAIGNT